MSRQLSLLVNFHSIANFQLLGFPWNMLKWEKRTMLKLLSICTSRLRLFLFLHLYQDTCYDFKKALIRTSGFRCSILWRKYTYYRSWRYLCLIFKGEFFSPLNNCNKIFVWRYWCKERKSWPDSSFQWHFKIQFLIREVMLMERTWVWGTQSCEYNLLIPLHFDLSLDRLELFLNRVFTSIIGQFSFLFHWDNLGMFFLPGS